MGWHAAGMGIGLWFGMGLFWIVLVGLIVWLVVQLARPGRPQMPPAPLVAPGQPWSAAPGAAPAGPAPQPWENPFEILDRRLAAGEIDLAAYQQLRQALIDSRGGPQ